jgi:hypothetical protein
LKIYDHSELYKAFNMAFKDRFLYFLPKMSVADAVPVIRVQYRGPTLGNQIAIENFVNFLIKQYETFKDITPYLASPDKLNLVLLYLEGCFLVHNQQPTLAEPLC